MTALETAAQLVSELDEQRAEYKVLIDRPQAIMLLVYLPGQRWEIECFDDGHIELERFISEGAASEVRELGEIMPELLSYFEADTELSKPWQRACVAFRKYPRGPDEILDQARRQVAAANGTPIEWRVAEPDATAVITRTLAREGLG